MARQSRKEGRGAVEQNSKAVQPGLRTSWGTPCEGGSVPSVNRYSNHPLQISLQACDNLCPSSALSILHPDTHLQAGDDLSVCPKALRHGNGLALLLAQLINVLLAVLAAGRR